MRIFQWPNIWSTLENVPCALERNVFCSCWVKCSLRICEDRSVYSIVQVFYFFVNPLPYWKDSMGVSQLLFLNSFLLAILSVFASSISELCFYILIMILSPGFIDCYHDEMSSVSRTVIVSVVVCLILV